MSRTTGSPGVVATDASGPAPTAAARWLGGAVLGGVTAVLSLG